MKNVSYVFLLSFVLFCGGCIKQTENELLSTDISTMDDLAAVSGESISNITSAEESFSTEEEFLKEDLEKDYLTMDQVKIFSENETLTLQDLTCWKELQESILAASDWNPYNFRKGHLPDRSDC